MKSMKYEAIGFSGVIAALLVLLAVPSGKPERDAVKETFDSALDIHLYGLR